jgi:hypothetical protein
MATLFTACLIDSITSFYAQLNELSRKLFGHKSIMVIPKSAVLSTKRNRCAVVSRAPGRDSGLPHDPRIPQLNLRVLEQEANLELTKFTFKAFKFKPFKTFGTIGTLEQLEPVNFVRQRPISAAGGSASG